MHSFIDNVVRQVISSQKKISKCTFILPSKRAGLFLKQSIKTNLKSPSILPEIYSIEEFIELSAPNSGKTIKDKYTCTTAKITPNSLYINGSGLEINSH